MAKKQVRDEDSKFHRLAQEEYPESVEDYVILDDEWAMDKDEQSDRALWHYHKGEGTKSGYDIDPIYLHSAIDEVPTKCMMCGVEIPENVMTLYQFAVSEVSLG